MYNLNCTRNNILRCTQALRIMSKLDVPEYLNCTQNKSNLDVPQYLNWTYNKSVSVLLVIGWNTLSRVYYVFVIILIDHNLSGVTLQGLLLSPFVLFSVPAICLMMA